MYLVIDVTTENPQLILYQSKKMIATYSWSGISDLSEKLLVEIDKFLAVNKITLAHVKKLWAKTNPRFMMTSNIVKTTVSILKWANG